MALANTNKNKLGINNQKLILFNLGKAISGPPTINGNKKFVAQDFICVFASHLIPNYV